MCCGLKMKGYGLAGCSLLAGVPEDIEDLFSMFHERSLMSDNNKCDYELFRDCFREKRMRWIYAGKSSEGELREFSEKLLILSFSYIVPPASGWMKEKLDSCSRHVKNLRHIFGIYLLYAFYFSQPERGTMPVNVTMDDMEVLLEYKRLYLDHLFNSYNDLPSLQLQFFGPIDCLVRLYENNAFHICAFTDEHNPLTWHDPEVKEKPLLNAQIETSDQLAMVMDSDEYGQLEWANDRYNKSQQSIPPNVRHHLASSSMTGPFETIKNTVRKYEEDVAQKGKRTRDTTEQGREKRDDIRQRRSAIKQKAYFGSWKINKKYMQRDLDAVLTAPHKRIHSLHKAGFKKNRGRPRKTVGGSGNQEVAQVKAKRKYTKRKKTSDAVAAIEGIAKKTKAVKPGRRTKKKI